MTSEYQAVYRQADALRHRFHDACDNGSDPEAQQLYRGLDNLAEDVEKQRSPRSLEQSANRLAEEFKHANSRPCEYMDPRHLNEFYSQLETIAHEARKLPGY